MCYQTIPKDGVVSLDNERKKFCFKMAGMTSVGRLLERHKSEFNDIDPIKLLQKLESAGAISVEERQQIEEAATPSKRTDGIINLISRKGYSGFQELCSSLESLCPHLLTKFALDILAGKFKKFIFQSVNEPVNFF